MRLSQSEIATFMQCRRRWWLGYYRQLRPRRDRVAGAQAIGTRGHAALAAYYSGGDLFAALSAGVARDLERYPEQEPDILRDLQLVSTMLEGYLQWLEETGADADLEVAGVEEEVEVPFGSGFTLVGKLDVRFLRRSDGARLFMDHKWVQSLEDIPKTAQISLQFLHYCLLQRVKYADDPASWCDGGLYNLLKKSKRTARAKPPFYDRVEVRHNDAALRAYWTRTMGVAEDIRRCRERLDAGEDPLAVVYPTPSHDCSWSCPFLKTCYLHDDGSSPEAVYEQAFERHDPYERYETLKGVAQ